VSQTREGVLLDRRKLVLGAAGAVASAGVAKSLAWPSGRGAAGLPSRKGVLPAPNPIPGGIELGPGLVIHVFGAGDPSVTLPFTGFTLQGLDVEPGTITDFRGSSAVAYHVGTATGSDGKTYNLETDVRIMEGEYVVDGSVHRGAFALI
jgi:hypothetical protein